MGRLFEPDIVHLCWECGDPLANDARMPSARSGYWDHARCSPIIEVEPTGNYVLRWQDIAAALLAVLLRWGWVTTETRDRALVDA